MFTSQIEGSCEVYYECLWAAILSFHQFQVIDQSVNLAMYSLSWMKLSCASSWGYSESKCTLMWFLKSTSNLPLIQEISVFSSVFIFGGVLPLPPTNKKLFLRHLRITFRKVSQNKVISKTFDYFRRSKRLLIRFLKIAFSFIIKKKLAKKFVHNLWEMPFVSFLNYPLVWTNYILYQKVDFALLFIGTCYLKIKQKLIRQRSIDLWQNNLCFMLR